LQVANLIRRWHKQSSSDRLATVWICFKKKEACIYYQWGGCRTLRGVGAS